MTKPTLKLPYKHPTLGWYFHFGPVLLIEGTLYITKHFVISWKHDMTLHIKPRKIQRFDDEPALYQWLKFNISFSNGWGMYFTYND